MSDIFDIFEICLQELESGADMDSVLAQHPDHAAELRPILKAALMARSMAAPAPSADAVRRGRAKVMQHAAQMREAKVSTPRRMIPIFQRLAISFALAALFLTSGTGLVSASSTALPGENLYRVKLTWENVRLILAFDEQRRESLEHSFENERLEEVSELLIEGRKETIHFAGVFTDVNGITYVSGVRVVILETSVLPLEMLENGAAVQVIGHTNAQGFVDVDSIQLLPAGSVVPTGMPVEIEAEHSNENSNDNENSNSDFSGSDNQNENFNDDDNGKFNDNNDNQNGNDGDSDSDDKDNNRSNDNDGDSSNSNSNSNDNSNTNSNHNSNSNGNDNDNGNSNDNDDG